MASKWICWSSESAFNIPVPGRASNYNGVMPPGLKAETRDGYSTRNGSSFLLA